MRSDKPLGERLNALTAAMVSRQREGIPVADWELARLEEAGGWRHNFLKVEQYMTTELFTVHEDESLDLVAYLMEWERIRHVPVEDNEHRLVGLVSYRSVLRLVARGLDSDRSKGMTVADVMKREPITISPADSTLHAIQLMREHQIACLPVVKGERLVGIITERDLMNVAAELLEEQLRDPN
jgi:CBS domain-containing protein